MTRIRCSFSQPSKKRTRVVLYELTPASFRISQRGIVIVMSLTVASHVLGIVAVYFQNVYLYVACFGLNVSCGTAVVFFHTAVDSKACFVQEAAATLPGSSFLDACIRHPNVEEDQKRL